MSDSEGTNHNNAANNNNVSNTSTPPQQPLPKTAVLFVGNISTAADEHTIAHLFSAYGSVLSCVFENYNQFALVEYPHADDADTAIAALHLRYCMAPSTPLLVMYSKKSPLVSEYGRVVARMYREAVAQSKPPVPVPLETFDLDMQRGTVQPPPDDLKVPQVMGQQASAAVDNNTNNTMAFNLSSNHNNQHQHQQTSFNPNNFPALPASNSHNSGRGGGGRGGNNNPFGGYYGGGGGRGGGGGYSSGGGGGSMQLPHQTFSTGTQHHHHQQQHQAGPSSAFYNNNTDEGMMSKQPYRTNPSYQR